MQVETWISNDGTSTPIPSPLPPEMQNREIKTTGYAGIANHSGYSTGKIEGWAGGKQKFVIQHPLLVGARWAYCNGIWLVLIARIRYYSMSVAYTISSPVYGGEIDYQYDPAGIHYYYFSSDIGGTQIIRPAYFYDAYEPETWQWNYFAQGSSVPAMYGKGSLSLTVPLKGVNAENIGAEVVLNQLSSFTSSSLDRMPNSSYWVTGGNLEILSFYSQEQDARFPNAHWYVGGTVITPTLTDIESKAKKWRVSPYNFRFREYAIDILNRPCPIQISVDPALNPNGEDHFCLDYQDYDGLMNRFNNIEQKLDQLPP